MDMTRRGLIFGSVGAVAASFLPVKLWAPEAAPLEIKKAALEVIQLTVGRNEADLTFKAELEGELVELPRLAGLPPGLTLHDYVLETTTNVIPAFNKETGRRYAVPMPFGRSVMLEATMRVPGLSGFSEMGFYGADRDPITFVLPNGNIVLVGDFYVTECEWLHDGGMKRLQMHLTGGPGSFDRINYRYEPEED